MSTILIISPEPWLGHFVSKHHYARELARRGHSVLFHGPPDATGPMRMFPVVTKDTTGDLNVLHAPRVALGLRFLPSPLRRVLEGQWLRQVESLIGKPVNVVWNFENSRFYDMRFAGTRLKIYHQVDLNQIFNPDIAAATADLAIAVSAPIEARIKEKSRQFLRITHGCPIRNFTEDESLNNPQGLGKIDESFSAFPENAVLTGNLEIPYLDLELIRDLVACHPTIGFHFVGQLTPHRGLHAMLGEAKNAIFWGLQSADKLPLYLNRASVLLVAYHSQDQLEQLANPHKMMEYMASGVVTVATYCEDYANKRHLLSMVDRREDFIPTFMKVVQNIEFWNSPAKRTERQLFAAENTYERQIERINVALQANPDIAALMEEVQL